MNEIETLEALAGQIADALYRPGIPIPRTLHRDAEPHVDLRYFLNSVEYKITISAPSPAKKKPGIGLALSTMARRRKT